MKKNIRKQKSPRRSNKVGASVRRTIGIDLGDKVSRCCMVNAAGDVVEESSSPTTKAGMAQRFAALPRCRIAIEHDHL